MAKTWYSPGEIRFTKPQCLWLIRNLSALREGHWPKDGSSYFDIPSGKKTGKHRAPFEIAIDYAVEIQVRLERAGLNGLILEAIESWGKSVTSMVSYLRLSEWVIVKRRKEALGFVAGWRRKVK